MERRTGEDVSDDTAAEYLENGPGQGGRPEARLDLIRHLLASGDTWADPSPEVFDVISSGITRVEVAGSPPPNRRRLAPAWGIAAVLVVALVGVLAWLDRPEEPEPLTVAMVGTEIAPEAVGTALLKETPAGWYIRLELEGLGPAPESTYYEGWMWRDSEGVSIGTFHLRGGAEPVALWSGVDPANYPAIRVTLQEEGSGPQTSDQVVMRGEIEG